MAITLDEAQALGRPDSVKKKDTGPKGTSAAELGDRFLKLLVTQMQNQDPLNPMQNAEVTSQLAQISTVTGVDKLNTSIEAMSKAMTNTQTFQASGLVGHSVLAPGKTLDLTSAGALGAVDLKDAANVINVEIRDARGLVVSTLALDPAQAGVNGFKWDGTSDNGTPLPMGAYQFSVKATNNGKPVETAQLAQTKVSSVTLGGSEVVVNTNTLGSLLMGDIKQIF